MAKRVTSNASGNCFVCGAEEELVDVRDVQCSSRFAWFVNLCRDCIVSASKQFSRAVREIEADRKKGKGKR